MDEQTIVDVPDEQATGRIVEFQGNNYYLMDDAIRAIPATKTKTGWHAEGDPVLLGRR